MYFGAGIYAEAVLVEETSDGSKTLRLRTWRNVQELHLSIVDVEVTLEK